MKYYAKVYPKSSAIDTIFLLSISNLSIFLLVLILIILLFTVSSIFNCSIVFFLYSSHYYCVNYIFDEVEVLGFVCYFLATYFGFNLLIFSVYFLNSISFCFIKASFIDTIKSKASSILSIIRS